MRRSHRRHTPTRATTTGVLLLAAAAFVSPLAACRQPLFSERNPRTQYDRYDRARSQFAPAYLEDEYGRKQPNLKGRLEPK
jgi:hypothetical protein